jgi:hypothetical protein
MEVEMPSFTNTERLALYTHLRTFESDFDKSQSQIRAICSAWSAAVLAAIALIAVNGFTPPAAMDADHVIARQASLAYLRNLVCMAGSAGVFAFWFVDQHVYQRLLHSVFSYGMQVEWKNPDLPQVRSGLYIANLDISWGLAWFYRMQLWIFVLIAAVFVVRPFSIDLGAVPHHIKLLSWIHLGLALLAEVIGRRWSSLDPIAASLYPDLQGAMPQRPARSARPRRWFRRELVYADPGRLSDAENDARWEKWRGRLWAATVLPPQNNSGAAEPGPR